MITKRLLAASIIFTLVGCAKTEDINQKTRREYMQLSCAQLKDKQIFLDKELEDIKRRNEITDGLNIAANVIGIISMISGRGGSCGNCAGGDNSQEIECKRKLEILREVMIAKKCDSYFPFGAPYGEGHSSLGIHQHAP